MRSRSASPLPPATSYVPCSASSLPVSSDYSVTTQLLVLYYVLLYESVRLNHMRTIVSANRKITRYSHELFADLPIKFLLQTAEKHQGDYGCLFPQLLRHCTTHFPHLCMVQDWLSASPEAAAAGSEGAAAAGLARDSSLVSSRYSHLSLFLVIRFDEKSHIFVTITVVSLRIENFS